MVEPLNAFKFEDGTGIMYAILEKGLKYTLH